MNLEHKMFSMLNNEALLEAYAGAFMVLGDGSLDCIIDRDVILSDVEDLKNEILNRMVKRYSRKGGDDIDNPMV